MMIKKILILISLTLLGTSLFANEDDTVVKKVVYDLTSGKQKKIERNLLSGVVTHMNHYEGEFQELEVRVVVHGDAYKFFLKDLNGTKYSSDKELVKTKDKLGQRLASLAKNYSVKFFVCEVGAKSKGLKVENFYPFIKMIPNSAIGLIDAQYEGFAYLPL